MAGRKFRFTTKKHIFKDLCQLWHTAITLTNSNKKVRFKEKKHSIIKFWNLNVSLQFARNFFHLKLPITFRIN